MCVLFHLIDAQSKDHEDFCGGFNGDCDDCLSASNVNDFNVLHVYVCMYVCDSIPRTHWIKVEAVITVKKPLVVIKIDALP